MAVKVNRKEIVRMKCSLIHDYVYHNGLQSTGHVKDTA